MLGYIIKTAIIKISNVEITTINFLDKKIPHIYFFKSICEGSFFITFNYFLLPERMNQNEPERKIDEKRPAIIPTIMGSAKF